MNERIKNLRKSLNMTQEEFSKRIGLSLQGERVGMYWRGLRVRKRRLQENDYGTY